jgi:hypothetical protein
MASADPNWQRRYLLGELTESERDEAEERLLRDAGVVEELEQAEDELVEGFLGGALAPSERQRFEDHFLASPRHRRQLQAARVVRDHFLAQVAAAGPAPARGLGPALLAAAAVLVLALAAELWWSRHQTPRPGGPPQASITTTTMPGPEPPSPSEHAVVLRLRPGQTMGAPDAARPQATLTPASETLRLELILERDDFDSYQARLSAAEGERWRVEHVRPLRTPEGATVVVEVPVRELGATDYRVRLFGERDGHPSPAVASYSFRVSGPRHSP